MVQVGEKKSSMKQTKYEKMCECVHMMMCNCCNGKIGLCVFVCVEHGVQTGRQQQQCSNRLYFVA